MFECVCCFLMSSNEVLKGNTEYGECRPLSLSVGRLDTGSSTILSEIRDVQVKTHVIFFVCSTHGTYKLGDTGFYRSVLYLVLYHIGRIHSYRIISLCVCTEQPLRCQLLFFTYEKPPGMYASVPNECDNLGF